MDLNLSRLRRSYLFPCEPRLTPGATGMPPLRGSIAKERHMTGIRVRNYLAIGLLLMAIGCTDQPNPTTPRKEAKVEKAAFGQAPSGESVDVFTLTNSQGVEARIITYGGIVTSLRVPDKNGTPGDIALGYNNLDGYLKSTPYCGAIIGRYGNRIAKGKFTLDGTTYALATNDGSNHLHGGVKGFDKVVWKGEAVKNPDGVGVVLTRDSP